MLDGSMHFDFSALQENGIARVGELNPYLTLACDLRCSYCYMGDYLAKASDQSNLMSSAFLYGMVDHFARSGGALDRVRLLGGEPTLHPDITNICNTLSEMPVRQLLMTTNAVSLHRLDLDKLKPGAFDYISISLDGVTPEAHDANRGKATHKKVIETLSLYKAAGISLTVVHTVTKNNVHQLNDTIPFFVELGASTVVIHRASLDGNAYNNRHLLLGPQDWINARDRLFNSLEKHGHQYAKAVVRIPYLFLTPQQIERLGYKPVQEGSYNAPGQNGHRLIVFPATAKGKGLCYMSADVIGQPEAELGYVADNGQFHWNISPRNELTAYRQLEAANVSHEIKHLEDLPGYVPVSDSFKRTMQLGVLGR